MLGKQIKLIKLRKRNNFWPGSADPCNVSSDTVEIKKYSLNLNILGLTFTAALPKGDNTIIVSENSLTWAHMGSFFLIFQGQVISNGTLRNVLHSHLSGRL